MRWHLGSTAAACIVLSAGARTAAQSTTVRSTDVARDATPTPKNRTNVDVVFDASAADLPQAEIRSAIERELGPSPAVPVATAPSTLRIGVDGHELVVRAVAAEGTLERRLELPKERAELPEMLALLAVNLTRDQRIFAAAPAARVSAPALNAPARSTAMTWANSAKKPPSNAPASYRRNWIGFHIAQDEFSMGDASVCNPTLPDNDASYSCWEWPSGRAYVPTAPGRVRPYETGGVVAQTRLLASYDRAFTPRLSLGARVGYGMNLMSRTRTTSYNPGDVHASPSRAWKPASSSCKLPRTRRCSVTPASTMMFAGLPWPARSAIRAIRTARPSCSGAR